MWSEDFYQEGGLVVRMGDYTFLRQRGLLPGESTYMPEGEYNCQELKRPLTGRGTNADRNDH